jgi:iron complex outermembrane receptor protein
MSINIKCSIAALLCGTVFAQNIFEGQIIDKNQKPIPFATVYFNNEEYHTNAEGKFRIET